VQPAAKSRLVKNATDHTDLMLDPLMSFLRLDSLANAQR
jgi:hypothetical protein